MEILSESFLRDSIDVLVRLVEAAGALIIFVGAVVAFGRIVVVAVRRGQPRRFLPIRLDLGRFLALGLEFQLASDILRTAVAPTLREIGQLAALAAIRTALNYFLSREIQQEKRDLQDESDDPGRPAGRVDSSSSREG